MEKFVLRLLTNRYAIAATSQRRDQHVRVFMVGHSSDLDDDWRG